MVYHANLENHWDWPVGHFGYSAPDDTGLLYCYLRLPYKPDDPSMCILPIVKDRKIDKAWQWDGNIEKPTFQPSILHHTTPPWHGFVTNGELVTA